MNQRTLKIHLFVCTHFENYSLGPDQNEENKIKKHQAK